MEKHRSWGRGLALILMLAGLGFLILPRASFGAAEIKLDRDFLGGVIENLPVFPFHKEGQYHGVVQRFRLLGINPKTRQFEVGCKVDGEFRPPHVKPQPSQAGAVSTKGWTGFRFDVRIAINIEPGRDGGPRFRVDVEEVKKRELEGLAGALAKLLGKSFDQAVTQVADGKATQLGQKINAEITKRIQAFRDYGVLCGIDYTLDGVTLRFDVTRLKSEGVVGYVYADPRPGTVPLTRWFHPKQGHHLYTITPEGLDQKGYRSEGIACYVFASANSDGGTVPLYRWRSRREPFYTTAPGGEGVARAGYRLEGIACALHSQQSPETIPFYRFVNPRNGKHFYTTHKYAEFAK